ncbi:LysR family transcriptional regulator substrate-binding protein [Floccifex sp.]|uniref:LysR family transcriptional regulator substrate-binding protein n=1 Tax=Floccifex sp. TaxID=2815810 RepID=UPI003F0888CA
MELEKYKILLKTIENGSLSATANQFGYSISGISRIISSIEKELGVSLLERTKEGVVPSYECKQLIQDIKEFVRVGDNIMSKASQQENIPVKIRIGVAHLRIYSWLTQSLMVYKSMHENIDVDLIYGTSSKLAKMVENKELHFAIISKRDGSFLWEELWQDEAVAWVPAQSPLAKMNSIPLSVFASESCVFPFFNEETDYSRIFKNYDIEPNIQIMTSDEYATYSVVESGLGITINLKTSSLLGNDSLVVKSLDPSVRIPIGISYRKDLSDVALKFMNDFANRCKEFE